MKLKVLDTLGMKCPEPVLDVAAQSIHMSPGDILEVIGDCPTFEKDIRNWCERVGRMVLSVKEEEADKKTIQIQF
jgi:tRNA 2-thiouridine synthesizing protein A